VPDKRIEKKVLSGKRLTPDDALRLFRTEDIFGLGRLASYASGVRNGNHVYFVQNRHINPTNLCVNRCRFCAFSRSRGEKGAFELSVAEVLERARQAPEGVREFHIVGGLHPDWSLERYTDMLSALKEHFPAVHLKAFTAVEIDYLAKSSGLSLNRIIMLMKDAGLDSLPGGGAEILGSRVRRRICPEKISGKRWLEVMRACHKEGLRTNATMLYGHLESPEDRVDHLRRLRDLQDETGGFNAFIPLAFQPGNTRIKTRTSPSGLEDLKTIAVSRLFLDNFAHIKAYWIMLGEKIAQLALLFGADDIDGTVIEEKIAHMAGTDASEVMAKADLIELIRRAGKIPVERDSLYNVVESYG